MKKKLSIFLILALTVFVLVACGNDKDTDSKDDTKDTSTSTEESKTDDVAEDKEVTIRVMVWDRGNAAPGTTTEDNGLTKWIQEQMKELYNINVEYLAVPRTDSDDKLNIMMTGETAPDIVFTYDQALFFNYATSGALHELSDVYEQYGSNIEEYCKEAQDISYLGDEKYAVMKQRGEESPRHISYIRKDWLDELDMPMPTTKDELETYLYAVKENQLGGEGTIPWAMAGRTDTEKMYLNFLGSYVNLDSDRTAYIYNEGYMAIAPGAEEGLKKLNTWYNDGLISRDFPTDSSEDVYKADIANGKVGFMLDDGRNVWDSMEVLNNNLGYETFVPIHTFELEDGSYRNPYEYRHAMFVMIPRSADEDKLVASMKYLDWMADPEVALNIRFTPDHTFDDLGVAIEPSQEVKNEKGYPGTCDDLNIMNLNFDWVSDIEVLAESEYNHRGTDWASLDWYKNFYESRLVGKFRFPIYAYISDAEQTYGMDVKTRLVEHVYTLTCVPADQFEAEYAASYEQLVTAGLQDILDGRAEYYDSIH